jgi:hypothetical protein
LNTARSTCSIGYLMTSYFTVYLATSWQEVYLALLPFCKKVNKGFADAMIMTNFIGIICTLCCGAWLSPVECTVRVREVESSNLSTPTERRLPIEGVFFCRPGFLIRCNNFCLALTSIFLYAY